MEEQFRINMKVTLINSETYPLVFGIPGTIVRIKESGLCRVKWHTTYNIFRWVDPKLLKVYKSASVEEAEPIRYFKHFNDEELSKVSNDLLQYAIENLKSLRSMYPDYIPKELVASENFCKDIISACSIFIEENKYQNK